MKYSFLLIILILFSCASPKQRQVKRSYIAENNFDSTIVGLLSQRLGLSPLHNGVDGYELRCWQTFLRDTFPPLLTRVVIKDKKISITKYVFFSLDTNWIVSSKYYYTGKYSFAAIPVAHIPAAYIDSFTQKYEPLAFPYFDAKMAKKELDKYYSINYYLNSYWRTLFEIADSSNYHRAYITIESNSLFEEVPPYIKYGQLTMLLSKLNELMDDSSKQRFDRITDRIVAKGYSD